MITKFKNPYKNAASLKHWYMYVNLWDNHNNTLIFLILKSWLIN